MGNHELVWESRAVGQELQSNVQRMIEKSFSYAALYFPVFQIFLKTTTAQRGTNTDELCGDRNWTNGEILQMELLKDQC